MSVVHDIAGEHMVKEKASTSCNSLSCYVLLNAFMPQWFRWLVAVDRRYAVKHAKACSH